MPVFYRRLPPRRRARRWLPPSKPALTHYTLSADAGSFVVTGQAASLAVGRVVVGASGTFTFTGQAAALLVGHVLSAGSGSFAVAGQDVAFDRTYVLAADSGSYTVSGQDAALQHGVPSQVSPSSGGGGGSILHRRRTSPRVKSAGGRWFKAEPDLDAKRRREEEAWREAAERALTEARLAQVEHEASEARRAEAERQAQERERIRRARLVHGKIDVVARGRVRLSGETAVRYTIVRPWVRVRAPDHIGIRSGRVTFGIDEVLQVSVDAPSTIASGAVATEQLSPLEVARQEKAAMLAQMKELREAMDRANAENARLKRNAQALEVLLLAA